MLLLTAINAKYIHSNLAVYDLQSYAKKYAPEVPAHVHLAEYTINHNRDLILQNIYEQQPDTVAFSCYIWNIEYVLEIAENLKKVCPEISIIVGGPEVSYDAEMVLKKHPFIDFVMMGEGEKTFLAYLRWKYNNEGDLHKQRGIAFRMKTGEIRINPPVDLMSMDEVAFPYRELGSMENRIIYYETSRGCPFSCSYCLSSIDKTVRFRNLNKVFEELFYFIEEKVLQVKFVDRTFNCRHEHAYAIWKFISEHDNGITNFHFEVSADLLREEDFELFAGFRPGLIQLEIGVQSTNIETIRAIHRKMDLDKLRYAVAKVRKNGNIHQHLDLIAGLPYEDYESFRKSFNEVFSMKPNQLQLGFLKVLKGSYMCDLQDEYQLKACSFPPYEVLSTKWLSYNDVIMLKRIEEMVEVYYNSFQFTASIQYLLCFHKTPFDFFARLGQYYKKNGFLGTSQNRISRYILLQRYFADGYGADEQQREEFSEVLTFDFYLRENAKQEPPFARGITKEENFRLHTFYDREAAEHKYLTYGYDGMSGRQLHKMTHLREFPLDMCKLLESGVCVRKKIYALFDYCNRSVLNHSAKVIYIDESEIESRDSFDEKRESERSACTVR